MTKYKLEFYQDSSKKWRWRAISPNNDKIFGAASQGFASKQSAKRNASLNGYI